MSLCSVSGGSDSCGGWNLVIAAETTFGHVNRLGAGTFAYMKKPPPEDVVSATGGRFSV